MKRLCSVALQIVLFIPLALASGLTEALEIVGKWTQGGLLLGSATPGTAIQLDGKPVAVSPEGYFALALGRDAPTEATVTAVYQGQTEIKTYAVAKRHYDVQRVDGVPQDTVTPPPDVLVRIAREAELVSAARAGNDPRLDYRSGFSSPLAGPVTGVYGSQRIYNGTPKNPHFGLDIAAPVGALVTAPAAGVVRLTQPDLYFSGGTLILDHGYGIFSTFIHLSEILVQEGDRVERGTPVAKVGATGRATGPHLDWRINWFDVRVDPALVMEQFPVGWE